MNIRPMHDYKPHATLDPAGVITKSADKMHLQVSTNMTMVFPHGFSRILRTGKIIKAQENEVVIICGTAEAAAQGLTVLPQFLFPGDERELAVRVHNLSEGQINLRGTVPIAQLRTLWDEKPDEEDTEEDLDESPDESEDGADNTADDKDEATDKPTPAQLDKMTKAELLDNADSMNITVDDSMTKAQIRELIDNS